MPKIQSDALTFFARIKVLLIALGLQIAGLIPAAIFVIIGIFVLKIDPPSFLSTDVPGYFMTSWQQTFTNRLYFFYPLSEELTFRGPFWIIVTIHKEKLPRFLDNHSWLVWSLIVVSAILFARIHDIHTIFMVSHFLNGIIWGWMVFKTRALLPSILAHGLWNFLLIAAFPLIPFLPLQ